MTLSRVSTTKGLASGSYVQDKNAESNPDSTGALANGYQLDDQDAAPEARLERVHCQERVWLERIAKEEEDGEHVDQQHHDHEENEENDHSAGCQ